MITNKELQQQLRLYPDDCAIAIAIEYEGQLACYANIRVDGISIQGEKLVIFSSNDINEEYEAFLDSKTDECAFNEKG